LRPLKIPADKVEARLRIIELEGAMPAGDIQVKRIPAVRVAELTATAARLEPASVNLNESG
jgi:hypothetical protein